MTKVGKQIYMQLNTIDVPSWASSQYLQQYVKKVEDISKPKMKTSLMYLDDIYLLFFD